VAAPPATNPSAYEKKIRQELLLITPAATMPLAPRGSPWHLATQRYQYSKPSQIQTRTSRRALAPRTLATTPAKVFTRTSHPAATIIRSLPKIITRHRIYRLKARNSYTAATIIHTLAILIAAGPP
jgi:hypothetical protein